MKNRGISITVKHSFYSFFLIVQSMFFFHIFIFIFWFFIFFFSFVSLQMTIKRVFFPSVFFIVYFFLSPSTQSSHVVVKHYCFSSAPNIFLFLYCFLLLVYWILKDSKKKKSRESETRRRYFGGNFNIHFLLSNCYL